MTTNTIKANIKFSIIIPARNGGTYLPACVESILTRNYMDFELIVSDDHSTDGSVEYLKTVTHPCFRLLTPPTGLSMTEHWEWALSQSSGIWRIFVGQDDGLQPYFFQLAEELTEMASKRNLRSIMSRRAYYFWPGCDFAYGKKSVQFIAMRRFFTKSTRYESLKALLGGQDYFELPEMYTTSLFHESLLEEAKERQDGRVFVTHPQDANLAAIACSLERKFLYSDIPLGWVGTSPKSAGMAISASQIAASGKSQKELEQLKLDYEAKVRKSQLAYDVRAGAFSFGNTALYYWQAILQTYSLRNNAVNHFIQSSIFKYLMFSRVLQEVHTNEWTAKSERLKEFREIVTSNDCSFSIVAKVHALVNFMLKLLFPFVLLLKAYRKLVREVFYHPIKIFLTWDTHPEMSMKDASEMVMNAISQKKMVAGS